MYMYTSIYMYIHTNMCVCTAQTPIVGEAAMVGEVRGEGDHCRSFRAEASTTGLLTWPGLRRRLSSPH